MPRNGHQVMTLHEFVAALGEAPNVADFKGSQREQLLDGQDLITSSVEFLRSVFPNPKINRFGADLWDVIGNGWVPAGVGPVPTLTFVLTRHVAMLMFPQAWADMLCGDRLMQIGAIVSVGSRALDHYNSKLIGQEDAVRKRAGAYEAEYLLTAAGLSPQVSLNDYQKGVLQNYPNGLLSVDQSLLYRRAKCSVRAPYLRGKPHAQ